MTAGRLVSIFDPKRTLGCGCDIGTNAAYVWGFVPRPLSLTSIPTLL
jgi:hypothetical protein